MCHLKKCIMLSIDSKNQLIFNIEETNLTLFLTQKLRHDAPNTIQFLNSDKVISESTKFLGRYINGSLN